MHVVVGAGPVGSATARLLAGQGEQVRVITRSGSGPEAAGSNASRRTRVMRRRWRGSPRARRRSTRVRDRRTTGGRRTGLRWGQRSSGRPKRQAPYW
ncbi:FAD-dependent monooxygenase [Kribbella sp. NBC_01484]|uniref:FAD-dependent monooxygenase n=1 Tax=Kribbella sp. NBC_01484 TaxID=2903579 RepID=UPI002E2F6398|nr:FAD-dependent monooxygenase [Kribbella sp. NBC_01484]